ncbi:MAG: hypothetical protein IKP00_12975 [Victivallales bacterium]|nr:hypothetical protein [Victivallales bacterium]
MKQLFFLCLVLVCFSSFGAFELFDKSPVQGNLREGAELVPAGGQDGSGALKISGGDKAAQYGYSYRWEKAESGQQYGISFAYLPADNFQGSAMVVVNFASGNWSFDATKALHRSVPISKGRWLHKQVIFTVPEGFDRCEATIRLDHVPADSFLLVDNLRAANISNEKSASFFKARFLDTIFDNWTFLGQQHFEHYSLGPGAAVVMDWKQAKAGESFLEIHGDGSKMQYPLIIYNLAVAPDRNYRFSCWYNASKHFSAGIKLFMFECMDDNRRHLDQPRVAVKATDGEWKELVFDFKTPANATLLDIMFNMRMFPADAVIRIDQLKFEEGTVGPDLRQNFVPAEKTMSIFCPVLGNLGEVSAVHNTYEVVDMKGHLFRKLESAANETLKVKLDDYPDGEYMLHAKIALSDGNTMEAEPRHFGVYKDPYWKNELGMLADEAEAPAPWCNLTRNGNIITAWNGTYRFGNELELEQMTEKGGTALLKRGIAVTAAGQRLSAAGDIVWKDGHSRIVGKVPVATENGLQGSLAMTMDYMGFVRYALDINVSAQGIDDVSVAYAVNDVEFIHRSDGTWSQIGAIDLEADKHWETKRRYHEMMLGNVERGIAWYSPKSYPAVSDFDHAVTVADVDGSFRVRLVNAPLDATTGKPYKLEFAVMPWPFRPSAEHWKHLRFRAYNYTNFNMMSSMKPMKYVGLPASKNDNETMEHAMRLQEPGAVGTLYQIPFYITDTMPEYRYFESEWQGYPARYYVLKNFGKNAKMRKCDTRNRLWQDLYCYMCVEYLKKFPWRGFYYDCYGSDLLTVNGEQFHPTFETRQFHERIYLTTNLVHPGFFTFTHAGGQQACTSAGFTDVTLMGEQYRASCMLHNYYLEFLTLNQFRYENAVRIGPDRMFLPQYRQPDKIASPEIAVHAVGLAFLHNCMLYPSFINGDVCKRMICWLYGFGLENASFFPYWKSNPDETTTNDATVPISYWKNERGFLATVLNSTKETKTVRVNLPEKSGKIFLLNPLDGGETPFASEQELTLPPYQAVLIRGEK